MPNGDFAMVTRGDRCTLMTSIRWQVVCNGSCTVVPDGNFLMMTRGHRCKWWLEVAVAGGL